MYISLSDDKHRFVRDTLKSALEIQICLGLHTAVVFRMQSFNFYCWKIEK